jgi:hypothetical protein
MVEICDTGRPSDTLAIEIRAVDLLPADRHAEASHGRQRRKEERKSGRIR